MFKKLHELYATEAKYRFFVKASMFGGCTFAIEEALRGNWANSLIGSCLLLGSSLLTKSHEKEYSIIDYNKRMEKCNQVAEDIEALLPEGKKSTMSFDEYKKSLDDEIHKL